MTPTMHECYESKSCHYKNFSNTFSERWVEEGAGEGGGAVPPSNRKDSTNIKSFRWKCFDIAKLFVSFPSNLQT